MSTVEINKENRKKFFCEKCHYSCNRKSSYNIHIKSKKHNAYINSAEKIYTCKCGKKYKHRSSFSRHNNICNYKINTVNEEKNDAFMELVKQNRELKELIINQNKQIIDILENRFC